MTTREDLLTALDHLMTLHGPVKEEVPVNAKVAVRVLWEFIDMMLPADDPDRLIPAWVTMDDQTPAFRCYLPSKRWNGWDCPWFGEIELRQLAHHITYDAEWNGTLLEHPEHDMAHRWEYKDHDADPYPGSHYLPVNATHKHPVSGKEEPLWDFSNGMCWLTTNR